MLLKYIFTTCALALGALAAPSTPLNDTTRWVPAEGNTGPVIELGYSGQEVEQIQQGHLDAVKLCYTMINSAKTETFNRILVKYFNINDRDLVTYVLNQIVADRAVEGNKILAQMKVEPDTPAGAMMDIACDHDTDAQLRNAGSLYPSLIICPRAFKHGSFNAKVWPGVADVNCDSIGPRVTWRMMTLGHILVHQYTFFEAIEGETLKALGGTTFDLADGPIKVLDIDRFKARVNADSYAWFVTELAWTLQCGRDFEAPMEGDDEDPY